MTNRGRGCIQTYSDSAFAEKKNGSGKGGYFGGNHIVGAGDIDQ